MTLNVIDTGTSQRNLDFACAKQAGWVSAYVKLGGDNVGRYVAPHYVSEVDRARAAGMRIGHYWVPDNDMDPIGAADYFVNNLRGWSKSDYAVLDNESLDGVSRYSDARAAQWIERVKSRLGIPGSQVLHYSGLHDARTTNWPSVLGTGTNFIIAAYSYPPLQLPSIPTVPANRIVGHQYSSSGAVCGVVTDRNAFVDSAFDFAPGPGPGPTPPNPGAPLIGNTTGSAEYKTDGSSYEFWVPPKDMQQAIQQAMKNRGDGRYTGPADGVWGNESVKGLQRTAAKVGYTGPIDGDAGASTTLHLQKYAAEFGDYTGPQDKFIGTNGWKGVLLGLQRP